MILRLRLNRLNSSVHREFYRLEKVDYEVPHYAFYDDMHIACLFDKEYHRAKVIDTNKLSQGFIKVFFIDYGTAATISTTGVYYLDEKFVNLPAQAIRARLVGIQPNVKDEIWPRETSLEFLKLVSRNENLVAEIYGIDNEVISFV